MKNTDKIYTFKETIRILGMGQSTLYLWIEKFGDLIPGIFQEDKGGWKFTAPALELLVQVKMWLRHEGWQYPQVIQELERRCNASNIIPTAGKTTGDSYNEVFQQEKTTALVEVQKNVIFHLGKMLETQNRKLDDLSEALALSHKSNKDLQVENSRIKDKIDNLENYLKDNIDTEKIDKIKVQAQLSELQKNLLELKTPWYSKFWSWLNQPITWRGKEVSVEIGTDPGQEKKKNTGLRPITEARAA